MLDGIGDRISEEESTDSECNTSIAVLETDSFTGISSQTGTRCPAGMLQKYRTITLVVKSLLSHPEWELQSEFWDPPCSHPLSISREMIVLVTRKLKVRVSRIAPLRDS